MEIAYCAEVGSNYMGSLRRAIQHIWTAGARGATHVKFQYFRGPLLTANPTQVEALQPYEVPREWLPTLQDAAMQAGVRIGYSVFHPSLVYEVARWTDFLKIAAYDLLYTDLVEACCQTGLPLVVSTAMANWPEIEQARAHIWQYPTVEVTWLMGTAAYPCPPHEANLSRMAELKKIVGPHVGLSDHTLSPLTASYAVALGATWIEKHFTLPNMRSPDTVVSIDPQGFKEMVLHCEEAALLLGTSTLGVRKCEEPLLGARRTNEQPLRR